MSAGQHWLGDAELWGLTPRRFAEIRDELDDHVACTEAREGEAAAAEQRESLAAPKARRRLSATYLADQVYATLNRWPTRREWLEFMWLGVWFVLIVASDWLALYASAERSAYMHVTAGFSWIDDGRWVPARLINLATAGWLLQGVARAGFFASLIASLWRAYRTGWGVVIARILQLKLIHTVLVVAATLMLGGTLWNSYPYLFGMKTGGPAWLTAPVVSGAIALIGVLLWLAGRRRVWHYALGVIICAGFLYPGGPYHYEYVRVERPLLLKTIVKPPGRHTKVPETDQVKIDDYAQHLRETGYFKTAEINAAANLMVVDEQGLVSLPFHVEERHQRKWNEPPDWYDWDYAMRVVDRRLETRSPISTPGAGLGWLAAPIPLLGILGFIGLIIVMGRRGPFEFALYLALTFFAIGSTFLPFLFAQDVTKVFDFGPLGVVHTPFPGFENLLLGGELRDNWLLIFGLLLSAGIPWLLTALFLRPGGGRNELLAPKMEQEAP